MGIACSCQRRQRILLVSAESQTEASVASVSTQTPLPADTPVKAPPPVAARAFIARCERARVAGESAALKLSGEVDFVDATPPLVGDAAHLRPRLYVVIRPRGYFASYTRGDPFPGWHAGYATSFRGIRRFIEGDDYVLAGEAIFHGFPSWGEAVAYWQAAYPDTLPRLLPDVR